MSIRLLPKLVLALAPLLALTARAEADDAAIKKAAEKLVRFGTAVADAKTKGAEVASYGVYDTEPSTCTDALAEAEKAGATDATRLYAYGWSDTLPSYEYSGSKGSSITLEAARGVCADYVVWRKVVKAAGAVAKSAEHLENSKQHGTGIGSYVAQDGTKCLDLIGALDATSRKLEVKIGADTMTLDAGRAICQELVDRGGKFASDTAAASGAKRAEVEAKWKKAGMKGDRLALFVDNELNGGGFPWYAKGCQTEIKDPKKLAKAKTLFNWTSGANGGTLVTKIVFKGNKYKETSREFFDEAKAYRWCK